MSRAVSKYGQAAFWAFVILVCTALCVGGQLVTRLAHGAIDAPVSSGLVACNGLDAKTIHDIEIAGLTAKDLACVLFQDKLGVDEPQAIATACSIPDTLVQAVIDALTAEHQATAQAAAVHARALAQVRDAGGADARGDARSDAR